MIWNKVFVRGIEKKTWSKSRTKRENPESWTQMRMRSNTNAQRRAIASAFALALDCQCICYLLDQFPFQFHSETRIWLREWDCYYYRISGITTISQDSDPISQPFELTRQFLTGAFFFVLYCHKCVRQRQCIFACMCMWINMLYMCVCVWVCLSGRVNVVCMGVCMPVGVWMCVCMPPGRHLP